MTRYFLGMDVGGTKTHALLADEHGKALAFGQAGPGNPEGGGYDELAAAMEAALTQALALAGIPYGELALSGLAGAGFGVGGYDWPGDELPVRQAIQRLGLGCPIEAANDTIIGLLAGLEQGWGVALVAGTGTNCRGRDRQGREGRVTGEGIRFGEFGGSSELMWKAVHAVNYAWIRRGPPTRLTERFLVLTGAQDAAELMEWLARGKVQADPGWAREIFKLADAGDAVAGELIAWSGRELGELACAVIRQLEMENETFEIALIGSLFKGGERLVEPLRQTITALAPKARLVRLAAPPVVGGVLLGRQAALAGRSHLGQDQGYAAFRQKLLASTMQFPGFRGE